jgi:S-adenosyl methyltransferase
MNVLPHRNDTDRPHDENADQQIRSSRAEPPDVDRAVGRAVDSRTVAEARRYNYWLGGKDHFEADRVSGDAIAEAFPPIRAAALANRRFLHRVVAWLANAGIRQFVDIGTGIPLSPNTHDVAQAIPPDARVVYVDNDPLVMAHARALMLGTSEGRTGYLQADLRSPDTILDNGVFRSTVDLSQPVAVLLVAVLHFLADDPDPYEIVERLVSPLPVGSFLVISHATVDGLPDRTATRLTELGNEGPGVFRPRTRDEIVGFFDGMRLTAPGVCPVTAWGADDEPPPDPDPEVRMYAAVGQRVENHTDGLSTPDVNDASTMR